MIILFYDNTIVTILQVNFDFNMTAQANKILSLRIDAEA